MNWKRAGAIGLLTLAHAALSSVLLLISFSRAMTRFDSRDPERAVTTGAHILGAVTEILLWPLFAPLANWGGRWTHALFPGVLGYLPLLLNSLVWALAIMFAWRWLRPKSGTGERP